MTTPIPTVTALPTPPQRGQDAAVFAALADAFIDAFPQLVADINAFGPALVQAVQERVTNAAADSYAGAAAARDAAVTAKNSAQGYANSINPSNLVHLTGDEVLYGAKNFAGGLLMAGIALKDAATKAKATLAQMRARQDDVVVTADLIAAALAYVDTPYTQALTLDCRAGINFQTTLTGNITTLDVANPIPGATLALYVVGDGSTARAISAYSAKFKGDLPPLTDITSTKAYELTIKVRDANNYLVTAVRAL